MLKITPPKSSSISGSGSSASLHTVIIFKECTFFFTPLPSSFQQSASILGKGFYYLRLRKKKYQVRVFILIF